MPEANPDNEKHENSILLTISEGAKLFGIDAKTIRRAIKNQEVIYVVVRGRYKIEMASLVKWSQEKTKIRNKTNLYGIGQFVKQWKSNEQSSDEKTKE